MAAQKQDDQLERTFSSYVRIQDVVLKTYLGRWTIGRSGERGSGISVLPARYDDDDEVVYSQLNVNTVLFKTIQFSISTQLSSTWLIDRTLSGATPQGQSEPESDSNEGVLCVPQSSSNIGTSQSDCLLLYLGHPLGSVTPLQRSSWCIIWSQPIGFNMSWKISFFLKLISSLFVEHISYLSYEVNPPKQLEFANLILSLQRILMFWDAS